MAWRDLFRRRDQPEEGGGNYQGRLTYPIRTTRGNLALSNSEVIYAAVSRISTTFGMMPCGLYKGFDKVTNRVNVSWLVEVAPNGSMTPFEFFRTMEVDRLTDGNGYAMIVPSATGGIHGLELVDPSRVVPMIEKDSRDLWYQVSLFEHGTIYLHNSRMIHVRMISADGIKGINPVQVLRGTLDYSASVAEFSLDQLRNGVHAGIILDFPAELSDAKRKKAVEQLLNVYKESGGAIIALDAGVRATRMDSSMIDPKLLDMDKITRSRVAAVYNLPPHLLGDYSTSSYESMEQEMLEFVALTIRPTIEMYRQEFNRKLLSTKDIIVNGISFKWDTRSVMLLDANTQASKNSKDIRSAMLTPNEGRAMDGRPPIKGGDRLFVSRDMVALDDLDKLTPTGDKAPATEPPPAPATDESKGRKPKR